jgi:hypothetical protein
MSKHDESPDLGSLSEEDLKQRIQQLSASDYFSHIEDLKAKVVGKTVIASTAGNLLSSKITN